MKVLKYRHKTYNIKLNCRVLTHLFFGEVCTGFNSSRPFNFKYVEKSNFLKACCSALQASVINGALWSFLLRHSVLLTKMHCVYPYGNKHLESISFVKHLQSGSWNVQCLRPCLFASSDLLCRSVEYYETNVINVSHVTHVYKIKPTTHKNMCIVATSDQNLHSVPVIQDHSSVIDVSHSSIMTDTMNSRCI